MEGLEKPCPLPVQALDQATGYLMAAAVARALLIRRVTGAALSAQLSLARTAHPSGVYAILVKGTHAIWRQRSN